MNKIGRFLKDVGVEIVKFVRKHPRLCLSIFGLVGSTIYIFVIINIQAIFVTPIQEIFVTPIIEEKQYEKKIDSLNKRINHLNTRIDTMHEQRDSVYSFISSLQTNLDSVTNNLKESQRLYNEHIRNHIWRGEIDTFLNEIATKAASVTKELTNLRTSIDSLNDEFDEHTNYASQMDSSLKKAVLDIQEQRDITLAVRVFLGTEKALKDQGYLSTPRFMRLFRQNYKIKNFPDNTNSKVDTVFIGKSFPVLGELVALCNYDGKLREGKDYTVSKGQLDTTHVVLSRRMIAGQPILAVLKN